MDEQIVSTICQLLRDGGSAAVWMWIIYLGVGLLKYSIGAGIIYYLITRAVKRLGEWIVVVDKNERDRQIRHNDEMEKWRAKQAKDGDLVPTSKIP